MSLQIEKNNKVRISGEIAKEPKFSYEIYGEKFYEFFIDIERLSGTSDILPVMISERLTDISKLKKGVEFLGVGEFRSRNSHEGEKSKLMLSIFIKELMDGESLKNINTIYLKGYLCNKPGYRLTPLGREIADVIIAVNRNSFNSDYIPAILWGRNARFVADLVVGTEVILVGRIQSRKYQKKVSEKEFIEKVAYEVSVNTIEVLNW